MNLRQTAEVAALVATSATHIVESPHPVPTASLHGYWKQSRTRLRCWFVGLRAARRDAEGFAQPVRPDSQQTLISLCREILVAELLTRVWSTVLLAHDRRQSTQGLSAANAASNSRSHRKAGTLRTDSLWLRSEYRSTVEDVFRGQQEARHEVLSLLSSDGLLPLDEQIALNRFRRRMERWTDALLGPLIAAWGVGEFAFDTQRAAEFSSDSQQGPLHSSAETLMPLLVSGLSAALPQQADADRERTMLNLAIVRAILSAFPDEAFGGRGDPRWPLEGAGERSSRHRPSPLRDAHAKIPGLSFVELRRREQQRGTSGD